MAKPGLVLSLFFFFFVFATSYLVSSDAKSVAAGIFALNGKTTAGQDSTLIDWDSIYSGEYVAHTSVFLRDYFNMSSGSPQRDPSSWFQGLSKDTNDIPNWRWTPNLNTNDKGNILNAYAAILPANDSSGEVSLFFGLDREAENGAATVGYWFLQDPSFRLGAAITKNSYAFEGKHMDGDLLIVADYPGQGSGSPASIQLLMWRGGNVSRIFYSDTNAKCNASDPAQFVCGITNDYDNVTSPWYYDGKFAQGHTIPARNFFEGGIQLAALAKVAGLSDLPCYSGFLATTRVSNQINSVSEDFAYGALKKCGLVLQANCLGGRQHNVSLIPYTIAPFDWNYTVSITNLGYTDVHDVVIKLNNKLVYNVTTLKSLETFARNNTVGTNTSDVHLVFKAEGSGLFPYAVVDSDNACTDPVPDNSLTPGEKAAIAVGSVVGAAIVGAAVAGAVVAGYIAMRKMNAAPPPEELTTELDDHGDDGAAVNGLFEDNVTEGTNPMFSAGASV